MQLCVWVTALILLYIKGNILLVTLMYVLSLTMKIALNIVDKHLKVIN